MDFLYHNAITRSLIQEPGEGEGGVPNLSWFNVAIASTFILVNVFISMRLGLKLEKSLLTSSIRCLVQLTMMGKVLNSVFEAKNPVLVTLMTFTLIFLTSCEIVYNKSKWSFGGMFPSVFLTTAFTTIIIGVLGTRYAIGEREFWKPEIFIPTMGLILGITAGDMVVGLSTILIKVAQHSNQIETYLSFGASRWEAGRTVAIEAIKLALLPTINRMSVIGLITIPGAMVGQILGGSPIMNAVRYQQIITFMVSATSSLGVLSVVYYCIHEMIDKKHRLRTERVHKHKPNIFKDIKFLFVSLWEKVFHRQKEQKHRSDDEDPNENTPILH